MGAELCFVNEVRAIVLGKHGIQDNLHSGSVCDGTVEDPFDSPDDAIAIVGGVVLTGSGRLAGCGKDDKAPVVADIFDSVIKRGFRPEGSVGLIGSTIQGSLDGVEEIKVGSYLTRVMKV
ncbi:hypothetical protein TWF106_008886 [Orbilia oligospora]|uniref:Uncharacterized protein n=1 Tax=Orbilia oligospora TaxID=2813651 RepID=A0A7C8QKK7_ORBOL|nr:hypothetical protein TWF106_008886 [Orbilia oligospora]